MMKGKKPQKGWGSLPEGEECELNSTPWPFDSGNQDMNNLHVKGNKLDFAEELVIPAKKMTVKIGIQLGSI